MGLGLGIDSGLRLRSPSTALSGAAVPLSGGARPPTPGRRLGPCDSAVARDFAAQGGNGTGDVGSGKDRQYMY